MKTNEGLMDRFFRILIGALMLAFIFIGPKTTWGLVGLVPFFTGVFGFCPIYRIFGFDTCPMARSK